MADSGSGLGQAWTVAKGSGKASVGNATTMGRASVSSSLGPAWAGTDSLDPDSSAMMGAIAPSTAGAGSAEESCGAPDWSSGRPTCVRRSGLEASGWFDGLADGARAEDSAAGPVDSPRIASNDTLGSPGSCEGGAASLGANSGFGVWTGARFKLEVMDSLVSSQAGGMLC